MAARILPLAALVAAALVMSSHAADPAELRLPTENHHLLTNEPDKFFMYVDRSFEGKSTKPWEGGGFGFVRSPIRVGEQVVYTHFHEGNDIMPMQRDKAGNPLDPVCAISDGTVAYANPVAGRSNYGKYVVVRHQWCNSPVYSLYAHLADVQCKVGDPVKAGAVLGKMGFTGVGINRTRAHVHLEITMMISERFDEWYKVRTQSANFHSVYNGMNLTGIDPAGFYLARRSNPELSFADYVTHSTIYFRVTLPRNGPLSLLTRYPWLLRGAPETQSPSWEIAFHATGYPIAVTPSDRVVTQPVVTSVRGSKVPHKYLTRGLVAGEGSIASLTNTGRDLVDLITDSFPDAPAATPAPADKSARKPKDKELPHPVETEDSEK